MERKFHKPMSSWNEKEWQDWENNRIELSKDDFEWPDIEDDPDFNEYEYFPEEIFIEPEWTDEDEAALEEYEEQKRIRIAEANEY